MKKLEELLNKTNELSDDDLLKYILKLQELAKKKLFVNIFSQKIDSNINLIELTNIFSQKNKKIPMIKKTNSLLGIFPLGTFEMSDDFDAPLDDFKDYM